MANYNLVATADFKPFSLQEMLVPFSAYKDAYEKSEEAYTELSDKADKFKYLSEKLPEGSKAREIYEGYANDLRTQAEDLAHNGLTMGNRRALTSLKRRYQSEIGRLDQADTALKEEQKLRRSLSAQDSSMMYGNDNLNIDDFLDGNNPNLYSISGKEIYSRGAATGKAFSSRMVNVGEGSMTLGGYYRDMVAKYGYSPEVLNNFANDMSAIPELKAAYDNYMEASGANANLSTANRQRATKEWLSGVLDGAIYQENHSPQRDLGVPTWAEKQDLDLKQKSFNLSKSQLERQYMAMGYRLNKDGKPYRDEKLIQDIINMKKAGRGGKSGSGSGSSSGSTGAVAKDAINISWENGDPKEVNSKDVKTTRFKDDDAIVGNAVPYDYLPQWAKDQVDNYIDEEDYSNYKYFYRPYTPGTIWADKENLIIVPTARRVKNNSDSDLNSWDQQDTQ